MLLKIPKEGSLSSTLGLKGSIGYIAPEYEMGGGVSPKGDVYSYGILLLESFTGKKPTDEIFIGELDLPKWVSMALPDRIMDILDPALTGKDNSPEHCLITVIKVGLACAEERPTMRNVSSLIKNVRKDLGRINHTFS
ncbi:Receptor kinase-like protein xa21 [Thalictrum thalictroides]|uniref:Receptor kinase-like protein xa21 n=1 Tax=Thalictrum thalictroides TaxID=46969 RepID=A0A7J6VNH7_THATH|nr:Receptor kinase-like protein xa21 [Thalictrum thalictroides]